KWNEFYDQKWIDWEPINGWIDRMDEPSHANDYWADAAKPPLNGCFNWRGDGYIWGTTEHYSPVCTLAVSVSDFKGVPVDGARIIIDADGVPGNFLTAGWTGSDGRCRFLLGDGISAFTASVSSPLGNINQTTVIRNSVIGKRYDWTPKLISSVSELRMQKSDLSNESVNDGEWKIEYSIDASRELVYGKHEYELYDYSFPCTFSDERQTGRVDMFICDSLNFSLYTEGKPFSAQTIKKDLTVADSFFTFSNQHDLWYLVLSGERKSVNTAVANLSIRLYQSDSSSIRCKTPAAAPFFSIQSRGMIFGFNGSLQARGRLTLELYSLLGKKVAVLFDENIKQSRIQLSFDLSFLPCGIYFCRMNFAGRSYGTRVGIFK
ncbi:MAG TPA: hypothetical protein VHP36_03010, partial [Chitinispirillaceae bacterium]|nr:hypothetical protein [Chitinispirillaceae bacterium]